MAVGGWAQIPIACQLLSVWKIYTLTPGTWTCTVLCTSVSLSGRLQRGFVWQSGRSVNGCEARARPTELLDNRCVRAVAVLHIHITGFIGQVNNWHFPSFFFNSQKRFDQSEQSWRTSLPDKSRCSQSERAETKQHVQRCDLRQWISCFLVNYWHLKIRIKKPKN